MFPSYKVSYPWAIIKNLTVSYHESLGKIEGGLENYAFSLEYSKTNCWIVLTAPFYILQTISPYLARNMATAPWLRFLLVILEIPFRKTLFLHLQQ